MEIVIEYSLVINFVLNSFIIKSTALFFKEKVGLWYIASFIGAVIALILPLFNVKGLILVLFEVFLSLFMVSISFSVKSFKRFCMIYSTFLGMTFIFGGACYFLQSVFGQLPLFCVAILAVVLQCVIVLVLKYRNKARTLEDFSFKVVLFSNGNRVEEEGFLDSGNILTDPITKKPIILITFEVFSRLYQNINYINAMMKNFDTSKLKNAHYIKVSTVASGTSMLVFTIDKMTLKKGDDDQTYKNVLLGLSFSGFDKALGKKVLLNNAFA